ncbi:IclR family transcriptional regulator [Mycetocola sp.]|uniref:IclR family transcriptional regulator n=1 Tax=Mycetocola sp. TaxID=1871042 RepID=UPI0026075DEA|nr:IclR family transcriptional regulator [Mycetocola sp.]MCU1561044.1 IclR family transcriptional regulator [Mycetocola sp.]
MSIDQSASKASTLVLHKITEILSCFSAEGPELTLQQIHKKTGLPSSTCQRLVQDMVHEGLLDRDLDRYRIGIAMVRWATPGTLGLDVVRLVKPALQELRDLTGETACFYVRDGALRTIVAVAETRHVVMRPFLVGMVMPIHAGAPGKIFLAFDSDARRELESTELVEFTPTTPDSLEVLDRQAATARDQGYYAAFGERNLDVGSISAPVFSHVGELAGAIGLGFPTSRVTPGQAESLGPVVTRVAENASRLLGYDPALRRR